MSDRTIAAILKDIRHNEELEAKDLDTVTFNVRSAFAMMKTEAANALVPLRAEYRAAVTNSALAFCVSTTFDARELGKILPQLLQVRTFMVDGAKTYRDLARDIFPAIGSTREFTVDHEGTLNRRLADIAEREGIRIPRESTPRIKDVRAISTFSELVSFVRELVVAGVGEEFNAETIYSELARQAMEVDFDGTVPIVIILDTDAAISSSLKRFATKVQADTEPADLLNNPLVIKALEKANISVSMEPPAPVSEDKKRPGRPKTQK
ncbi:MAG: hypothetical protein H0U23_03120 [Blastocatellia bacterium]|nr:hypothetical protein [Blastocatellia bacterium]